MPGTSVAPVAESPSREELAAAFDFARQLREPSFRARLQGLDYDGPDGHQVLAAPRSATVGQLLDRARQSDMAGRVLLAVADEGAEHGFELVVVELTPRTP